MDLCYKVKNLIENQEYEFRVFAENVAGAGAVSKNTPYIVVQEPKYSPDSPLNLRGKVYLMEMSNPLWYPSPILFKYVNI